MVGLRESPGNLELDAFFTVQVKSDLFVETKHCFETCSVCSGYACVFISQVCPSRSPQGFRSPEMTVLPAVRTPFCNLPRSMEEGFPYDLKVNCMGFSISSPVSGPGNHPSISLIGRSLPPRTGPAFGSQSDCYAGAARGHRFFLTADRDVDTVDLLRPVHVGKRDFFGHSQ